MWDIKQQATSEQTDQLRHNSTEATRGKVGGENGEGRGGQIYGDEGRLGFGQ